MRNTSIESKLLAVRSSLLSFAYSLTHNRDDAYDLLQDTSLKVLDSEDKYGENVNFKGWVFTIMRNLFINGYRRQMRSIVTVDTSEDLYQLNLSQDSGLDTPQGTADVHDIIHIIDSLPQQMREPFKLYISGYHYNEIADILELPQGTVKSRIHLARHRLQTLLGDMI